MAIVKEIITSQGALVRIHDDAYVNASPEEIKRRIEAFKETAKKILIDAEIRRIMAEE